MAGVEIELDSAGIREMLKSAEIEAVVRNVAERKTKETGARYVPKIWRTSQRVMVKGLTSKADADALKNG